RRSRPGGVADRVRGGPVARGADLAAADGRADVTPGLLDVLLYVVHFVSRPAKDLLVLETRLGLAGAVNLRDQPPPASDQRLEHHRIPEAFAELERGGGREGDPRAARGRLRRG